MAIVTLTTDFGLEDYLVAAVKGQLCSAMPQVQIVDLSHLQSRTNYPQTAYFCEGAFKHFPANTCHMVLVNMFDEQPVRLLLARHHNQYIACADNGLLTMIFDGKPAEVLSLPMPAGAPLTTLLCTGVLIAAIAKLMAGTPFAQLGDTNTTINEKLRLKYVNSPTTMEGQILYIDRFENVIVNITRQEFDNERRGRNFKIVFKRDEVIDTISDSYASVPPGEKVAMFNAAGYLEIAVNGGNAAGLFGLKGYTDDLQKQHAAYQNKWFYQTVKIFFE